MGNVQIYRSFTCAPPPPPPPLYPTLLGLGEHPIGPRLKPYNYDGLQNSIISKESFPQRIAKILLYCVTCKDVRPVKPPSIILTLVTTDCNLVHLFVLLKCKFVYFRIFCNRSWAICKVSQFQLPVCHWSSNQCQVILITYWRLIKSIHFSRQTCKKNTNQLWWCAAAC